MSSSDHPTGQLQKWSVGRFVDTIEKVGHTQVCHGTPPDFPVDVDASHPVIGQTPSSHR
jgi:hypothetical protein